IAIANTGEIGTSYIYNIGNILVNFSAEPDTSDLVLDIQNRRVFYQKGDTIEAIVRVSNPDSVALRNARVHIQVDSNVLTLASINLSIGMGRQRLVVAHAVRSRGLTQRNGFTFRSAKPHDGCRSPPQASTEPPCTPICAPRSP
ncbi:MAG: hypothetical protein AAF968_16445, partial [Pseudomonadota bacterium]